MDEKAKGGRVGLKAGTNPFKRKTNIDKIKETFAPKKRVNAKGGKLITIDRDKSLHDRVHEFFKRSDYAKNIQQLIGEAINIIPEIDLKFDLVFIDADKKNYKNYFDQVIHKLNKGGIIIVDNVLWKGKVTDLSKNQNDKIAVYMNDFNEYIKKNKKVSKLILPVRDGLTLIIKDEN